MATLVLDRPNLELRADGAAIALYENGDRRGTVPLNLLERLVIQGNVRLDTSVLGRIADEGVATVLLSRRHGRRVAFLLGGLHSDASVRVAQCQLSFDRSWCDAWSRRVVRCKILGQTRFLRHALAARPDCRKPLVDALESLRAALSSVSGNDDIHAARVRGFEGAAAAAYFRGVSALFPESLGFAGRTRRPPRDPVNACLSLGYTLLHFEAVRACHAAGLDPLVGFYHRPAFGRESMACDLVEPVRARIDAWVWSLFRERQVRAESFTHDKGACVLNKAGRARFYECYEEAAVPMRRHLRRECGVLVRWLRRRGEPLFEAAESEEE
jgi:CRISPR-associated protein Cas1